MEMMGQLAAVAGVLMLLAATLWWLRRHGFAVARPVRRNGRLLQSLERLPLGPQHTLHLVRFGRKALLVGCSPGGCAVLTDVTWAVIEPEERP